MKNAEPQYLLSVSYPDLCGLRCTPPPQTVYRLRRAAAGPAGALTVLCRSLQRAAACRMQGERGLAGLLDAEGQIALRHLELLTRMLLCCGAAPGFFVPQGGHKIWWSAGAAPRRKENVSAELLLRETLAQSAACRALAGALPPALAPCAERMLADWEHHASLLRKELLRGHLQYNRNACPIPGTVSGNRACGVLE